ncbi:magnesium transporter NIPA-domain-containing protein [Cyathus striatus]|nr:magnesium transporter NIPA-domain-containing protein [Cyathus striatus]
MKGSCAQDAERVSGAKAEIVGVRERDGTKAEAEPAVESGVRITPRAASLQAPKSLKVVGIILAISSGLLIGSSFVFKKKGLLRSQAGGELGEGVAYLKSPLWWLGMSMMILGEICNFAGAPIVFCLIPFTRNLRHTISFFLQEKLSFFGWLGCTLCILGSVIIALNGPPQEESVGQIREFEKLFLAPGFLAYTSVLISAALVIIFYFAPRYGKKSMLWYIFVCSMIGGISVSVTTGLGAAIVTTAMGENQFKFWFIYFLMAFVAITLVTEVYYLNVALALFNTGPFKGLQASASDIITLVMGFLVICVGITILQMSKVDPEQLSKLDRKSTILLQAARRQTENQEKDLTGIEDPGMDALRGSFGAFGSIIRARTVKRMSQSSRAERGSYRSRPPGAGAPFDNSANATSPIRRDEETSLYDAPMPKLGDDDAMSMKTASSIGTPNKKPTVKFGSQDLVHQYGRPGTGDDRAFHDRRPTMGSPRSTGGEAGYPPLPTIGTRTTIGREGAATAGGGNELAIPRNIASEHEVHSAPAAFARPTKLPVHKDSRELFDSASFTARGTLLSFPSVTDSARSSGMISDDAEKDKAMEREKEKARERERGRSAKRYPRGDNEDDREESMSLWQQGEGERESSDERSSTDEGTAQLYLVDTIATNYDYVYP